jgi:hypothetical protein
MMKIDSSSEIKTDHLKLGVFMQTCGELVGKTLLEDRAKLIKQLLSQDQTAALLSIHACSEMPIWHVRQEAVRRGQMIEKAIQNLRSASALLRTRLH